MFPKLSAIIPRIIFMTPHEKPIALAFSQSYKFKPMWGWQRRLKITGTLDKACLMLPMCFHFRKVKEEEKQEIYSRCMRIRDQEREPSSITRGQTWAMKANNMQRASVSSDTLWWKASLGHCCSAKCQNPKFHFSTERQKQQRGARRQCLFCWYWSVLWRLVDCVMKSNKNTTLNPFCFYNRDHAARTLNFLNSRVSIFTKLHVVATGTLDQLLCNLHHCKGQQPIREGRKKLNEEHLVFTGGGSGGDFCGSGESSYDGGEDDIWAPRGIDGRVQTPGAVVLHQRDSLPVVGIQAGAQCLLVVITAADERFTCHVILHGRFGGVILLMVGAATWLVD